MDFRMTLSDGREMSYAIYGHPQGKPLVALHGSADSRLTWQLLDADARQAGVRLIAPDRPGFGRSPYNPGRTTVDHAHDVVELADHLDLEHFDVISISGGLVFGLAAAWAHPDRVRALTSYSGLYLTAPGAVPEMNPLQRMIASVGLKHPAVLRPLGRVLFGPQVLLAKWAPSLVFKMIRATRPEGDRAVLDRPEVAALMIEAVPVQFRSVRAVTDAFGAQQLPPFPFTLSEIQQPIHLWQGGQDDVHTPAMARYIAAECPGATLYFHEELATFDFDVHYPEMLAKAVAGWSSAEDAPAAPETPS